MKTLMTVALAVAVTICIDHQIEQAKSETGMQQHIESLDGACKQLSSEIRQLQLRLDGQTNQVTLEGGTK